MDFKAINQCLKRAQHFSGVTPQSICEKQNEIGGSASGHWIYPDLEGIAPVGMGISAHNFEAMKGRDMSYLDMILWLDALAKSFNRYIDANKIADDENAKACLSWWANHLFFDPRHV